MNGMNTSEQDQHEHELTEQNMKAGVTGFALVSIFLHGSIPLLFNALIPNIAFVFKYFDILRAPKPITYFHFRQFSDLQRRNSLGK